MTRTIAACVLAGALATAVGLRAGPEPAATRGPLANVVVTLQAPPLAYASGSRERAAARIAAEQARFARALRAALPQATLGWRYRIVANGVSIVLPAADLPRLERLPGVAHVVPPTTYGALAGPDAEAIRARGLPGLANGQAGDGIKIGVIDDGIDQSHPFFDPSGFTMPPGYPKGQVRYTSAKVIVARAFAPPGTRWRNARLPFDPVHSRHATHVAGIAAGNAATPTNGSGARVSGVAPRAYLGNYKALSVPTDSGVGLDGNAPELVAAIEAAVADGMDVINLSIGEPEIEPARDVVALALDAAAAAGVVPVVAAGNDYDGFGVGSVSSPGSSQAAITVGALSGDSSPQPAGFSSAGPTALSLRLKPDVAAPGVAVVSSVPGGWAEMSGTSMAAPHVSGAAAILLQRHGDWLPSQVKAALVGSARPVAGEAPTRAGAGLVDVAAADAPLVLASPESVSLGLLADGAQVRRTIDLEDAGGPGEWQVSVELTAAPGGATVTVPPVVAVPGSLELSVSVAPDAADADVTGRVVLRRGEVARRVPFWGRLATPQLSVAGAATLTRPGTYAGSTRGRAARVSVYRYPEVPRGGHITAVLAGPEQAFRVRVDRRVANFGVVITSRGRGVDVEPRVVEAGDENRLTGYPALPFNLNPYLVRFGDATLVAGAVQPAAGTYHVVFDGASAAGAGPFRFRYWVDDVVPPTARLVAATVRRGDAIRVRVGDGGSGVDPTSLAVRLGERELEATLRSGVVRIDTSGVAPGTYRLRLQVSDFQETRNMENVARILPNTRVLTARVTIQRRR